MVQREGIFGEQSNQYVECRCRTFEHTVRVSSYIEYESDDSDKVVDSEVYLEFAVDRDGNFFQRLMKALKLLFRRDDYLRQEIILDRENVKNLASFLNEFLSATDTSGEKK